MGREGSGVRKVRIMESKHEDRLEKWRQRKAAAAAAAAAAAQPPLPVPPVVLAQEAKPVVSLAPSQKRKRKRLQFDDDTETAAAKPVSVGLDPGASVSLDDLMASLETPQPPEKFKTVWKDSDSDSDSAPSSDPKFAKRSESNEYSLGSAARRWKNKDLPLVDYSDSKPFQRVFYQQPPDVLAMTPDEVQEYRYSMDNTKITGKDCPRPVTRWSQLGLSSHTMQILLEQYRFKTPTAIQAQALPATMTGRDVIGISKTGSGKTIAYILPLLRQVEQQKPLRSDESGPLGLIMAPTRELAAQIHTELQRFKLPSTTTLCCTGGSELKKQIDALKRGVHIVVATPGRFIDLLTLNSGRLTSSKRITFVVLDEADRLFDMGFEPQITKIMKTIRPDKQCVLYSATFPAKLRSFASKILHDPLTITINSQNLINENVSQKVFLCETDPLKFERLIELLENFNENNITNEKVIVFVHSQQICDLLYEKLKSYNIETFPIHAGKPFAERQSNLNLFRSSSNGVLLATEVLSRGLNVPETSLVVIYNAIKTFASYVHTTGRTARGTNKGTAITLLLPNEISAAFILKKALRPIEYQQLDSKTSDAITEMATTFQSGLQTSKYRLSKGFGGKGLDNLDTKRKENEHKQQQQQQQQPSEANLAEEATADMDQVPHLQYSITRDDKNGEKTFTAQVEINDLPQLVRWEATKNTTLVFIKQETGCSITTRGKFYSKGKKPTTDSDEPKLYLLIEAKEEKDIILSIDLLEQKVKQGIKKAEIQTMKSNKY